MQLEIEPAFSVEHQQNVCEKIENARVKFPKIDEIMKAWDWRLIHDRQQGYLIPGTNPPKYVAKSAASKQYGVPAIRLVYSVAATIISIKAISIE